MKKLHHPSLKFHTIYSLALSVILFAVLLYVRDITLGVAVLFLTLYIAGNGIIHAKHNELKRDTLVEYTLVAVIVLIVIIGLVH